MALTDSLVAYWKLDESSGTRNDSHGSNHLTDNNTVGSASGKISNAADFERDNDEWLSITDNASISMGDVDFTWTAWVFFESFAGSGVNAIIYKLNGAVTAGEFGLEYQQSSNRFHFAVSHNGALFWTEDVLANNLGAPSTSTWYFIVAWHDSVANTINIQVNDGTVNSAAHAFGVADTSAPLSIGGVDTLTGVGTDGLIDEVGFWKRVLTSDERTALYNSGAGLAYPFTGGGAVPIGAYAAASQHFIGVS